MTPEITVCMAVYKGEATVKDAIESVLAQTFESFELLISVDPSGDQSAAICRAYADHPKVTLIENPARLGWVGNFNACLDRVNTPFFAFCHNDDTFYPRFLDLLHARLSPVPGAVAAFGGIERHGLQNKIVHPKDCIGTPAFRAKACLDGNMPAYGLKNLMRSDPVLNGLRLPAIGKEGFCADWPFAFAYSLAGDFLSVQEVLYRKEFSADSASAQWLNVPVETLIRNLASLDLHFLRMIAAAGLDLQDRQDLVRRVLLRIPAAAIDNPADLRALSDAIDFALPTLIIAELLGDAGDPVSRFGDPEGQIAAQAQFRRVIAAHFNRLDDPATAERYQEQANRLHPDPTAARAIDRSGPGFLGRITKRWLGKSS